MRQENSWPGNNVFGLYCIIVINSLGISAQVPAFRAESRLVEIPVVVLDKKTGQPVRNLAVGDFQLFEAGKLQRIEFFSAYSAATAGAGRTGGGAGESSASAGISNRRQSTAGAAPIVTILIDGYNARYEEQYYAARAAAEVIMRPEQGAQWAVYFLGRHGLRVLHDYTEDSASVAAQLRSLRTAGNPALGLSVEPDDEGQTETAAASTKIPQVDAGEEARIRVRTTLTALRDIGRHLGAQPGRKSLIWMTAGISMRAILGTLPELWHGALDVLNDANVAVYAVDSAGVRTLTGFLAERPTRALVLRPSAGSSSQMTHVMLGIAEGTGGRAFLNTNDLAASVSRALNDSQTFYRLAYRPTHGSWDGRHIAIQVKIPNRRGLEIRHRLGYFARAQSSIPEDGVDRLLAEAVASPLDAVDVGLTIKLTPVPGSDRTTILLTAEPYSVSLEPKQDRFYGRFDVRCVQLAADAQPKQDFTDEVILNLDHRDAQRTVEEGFHYTREIALHPDARIFKVAFCDRGTGRLGSIRLELPGKAK